MAVGIERKEEKQTLGRELSGRSLRTKTSACEVLGGEWSKLEDFGEWSKN